jgi:hypothetical protein
MRLMVFVLPLALAAVPAIASQTVPAPAFKSVQLRGGGSVLLLPGPAQQIRITQGSAEITRFRVDERGQLRIDACTERCPPNYRLRIEIVSPTVPDVAVSGGGSISAAPGFAPQSRLAAAVNGGGGIDLRSVSVSRASIAVNGGGRVLAGELQTLSAAVNGGGTVRYSGNPRVSSAVRGGGTVRRD